MLANELGDVGSDAIRRRRLFALPVAIPQRLFELADWLRGRERGVLPSPVRTLICPCKGTNRR